MILTCPHCDTQFRLNPAFLGEEGNRVKCTVCEEVWFQKPEGDSDGGVEDQRADMSTDADMDDGREVDNQGDAQDEGLDIPEGVKPIDESDDFELRSEAARVETEDTKKGASGNPVLFGYLSAAVVFLFSVGLLLSMQSTMVKTWPASITLYNMLGMGGSAPGEGLVFDRISVVTIKPGEVLVTGHIINLKNEAQVLPGVVVLFLDDEGDETEPMTIALSHNRIDPQGSFGFEQSFDVSDIGQPQDAVVRFVLSAPDSHIEDMHVDTSSDGPMQAEPHHDPQPNEHDNAPGEDDQSGAQH